MKLSASQAARSVGKSVPTITRAIKNGKLSAVRLPGGGYEIEPSELYRVWPAVTNDTGEMSGSVIPPETSALEREVELLREMLDETRADRDQWREQAQKITGFVEDARPVGFWARLFGR